MSLVFNKLSIEGIEVGMEVSYSQNVTWMVQMKSCLSKDYALQVAQR